MTGTTTDIEQAVREATQRWLDGTMSGDADALDRLLDADYTYTHASSAAMDTRDVWLESFRSGRRRYHVYAVEDLEFRILPGGVVVTTGRAHQEMSPRGELVELNTRFLNAWVHRDDGWRLVAWQATRLAEPAP